MAMKVRERAEQQGQVNKDQTSKLKQICVMLVAIVVF